MISTLYIVGIGPGNPEQITPQAQNVIAGATDLVGYGPYLERVKGNAQAVRHGSDNRKELDRAVLAITLAQKGKQVAVISGGDSGVFGMASAVFEILQLQPLAIRQQLDIQVIPGLSAVLACAARIGAPIGGDFCVMSLSDNLKPWHVIKRRLIAVAQAGFVIALYNPRSKARPNQLGEALGLLKHYLAPQIPIAFVKAAGREDEDCRIITLAQADPDWVDMRTLVIIGNAQSHLIPKGEGQVPWFYTERKLKEG